MLKIAFLVILRSLTPYAAVEIKDVKGKNQTDADS